ncbi:GNAT family N-acetyltransferase [Streptomyces flavofungini]|uniref:GNAT family N-acetyltransferase n=1 Tax=Streptomyces flavofungini TaxID=68200 RepID=A0ABS0WY96_9ACTN|nr:GNAT family N-acetyltransferase [Streptomyces flavofungini]MBJ3805904.1 GNAT family N-acetyltransferase [Streptomyces flavofungini]GHC75957.1 glycosyl transferase family 1 [Streptomyces flavofungini]
MTTATRSGLTAGLCVDEDEFASLAGPWRRLYETCEEATPFQSHAWLTSWWRSYGRRGRLRVLLVRDGGELVAAAPLMRVHRPVPALRPLGGAISDFADVLLAADCRERAADALAEGMHGLARGALIDFREARPGACVESVYDRWCGPRRELADSPCLELPPLPVDELLKRLPATTAQRARAKLRKLTALGVRTRVVPADEVETSLATLLRLHELQWQGRKVTTEHLRPRFREHLLCAVRPMVAAGDAVVTEFHLDGEVLAADLTLLSARLAGGYLYGAHPRLRERKIDVATMLLDACTRHTSGPHPRTLSLLRGDEPYKQHWRPTPAPNRRFLLAHSRTAPLLTAAVCEASAREWARGVRRDWQVRQQQRERAGRAGDGQRGSDRQRGNDKQHGSDRQHGGEVRRGGEGRPGGGTSP